MIILLYKAIPFSIYISQNLASVSKLLIFPKSIAHPNEYPFSIRLLTIKQILTNIYNLYICAFLSKLNYFGAIKYWLKSQKYFIHIYYIIQSCCEYHIYSKSTQYDLVLKMHALATSCVAEGNVVHSKYFDKNPANQV